MAKAPFDYINDLTLLKTRWEDQSESDKKGYAPFMINRWISMSQDWIEIVAETQRYTAVIPPEINYLFYRDIMPKSKLWIKYTKSKSEKIKELGTLMNLIASRLSISTSEAESYINVLEATGKMDEVREWVSKLGFSEKELNNFKL